jgi:mRNA-degrading endonuclease toxin of MazEF toxin-antitoxin module
VTASGPGAVIVGGVYLVQDKLIRLLPEEERVVKDPRRPVVVVSGPDTNGDAAWPLVLACPISGSTSRRTKYDAQLAAGQGGVIKKCWVRVPAVQPLQKTDLQDRSGTLDERLLAQVHTRLVQYMGLV